MARVAADASKPYASASPTAALRLDQPERARHERPLALGLTAVNVFVADGSALPTQGSANPALTIMAAASRLADRLASAKAPSR